MDKEDVLLKRIVVISSPFQTGMKDAESVPKAEKNIFFSREESF